MPEAMLLLSIELVCEGFGKKHREKKYILLLALLSDLSQCGKESPQMS